MKMKKSLLLLLVSLLFFAATGLTCNQTRTVKLGLAGFCPPGSGNLCTNVTAENNTAFWSFVNANSDYYSHHTGMSGLAGSLPFMSSQAKKLGLVIGIDGLTTSNATEFTTNIANLIGATPLEYVCVGNEIDNLPNLAEITPAINSVLKNLKAQKGVKTCTVFQYERMSTMSNKAAIVAGFPDADIIAYTVYPFTKYAAVSQIPANYFDFVKTYPKGFAITEVSWPSAKSDYTNFMNKFISILPNTTVFVNYYSPFDMTGVQAPFDVMGLNLTTGAPRPTATQWANLYKTPYTGK
jgi:hypothetical protein